MQEEIPRDFTQPYVDAVEALMALHGEDAGMYAEFIANMFRSTEMYLDMLQTVRDSTTMTNDEHSVELTAYLHMNALQSELIALAMNITVEQANEVFSTVKAAHRRALTNVERCGAELH